MSVIIETIYHGPGVSEKGRVVSLPGSEPHVVKHNQIILWVSIIPKSYTGNRPPRDAPIFPAILDTGCNVSMTMTKRRFRRWCSRTEDHYHVFPAGLLNGEPVENVNADVWVYRMPAEEALARKTIWGYSPRSPRRLRLRNGVTLIDESPRQTEKKRLFSRRPKKVIKKKYLPSLPTIGLEVLASNKLNLEIDGYSRHVWVRDLDR